MLSQEKLQLTPDVFGASVGPNTHHHWGVFWVNHFLCTLNIYVHVHLIGAIVTVLEADHYIHTSYMLYSTGIKPQTLNKD